MSNIPPSSPPPTPPTPSPTPGASSKPGNSPSSPNSLTWGVNRIGSRLLTAVVLNDGSRLSVNRLIDSTSDTGQIEKNQTNSESDKNAETKNDLSDARLFFSVSPEIAIIRKIKLQTAPLTNLTDLTDLVRFEMSQSLLEPPESFYFDALPVGAGTNGIGSGDTANEKTEHQAYLSIAYHRHQIDALMDDFKKIFRPPSGFKLDAVALVDGYLAFCQRDPGELEAILELDENRVAIGFVYRDHLYGVADLQFQCDPDNDNRHWSMMATEIKMMLDFQLSRFFDEGITVPLSRVIVSGRLANHNQLRTRLDDLLATPISLPRFHKGYFQPLADKLDDLHPEQFLIPLGLAVE